MDSSHSPILTMSHLTAVSGLTPLRTCFISSCAGPKIETRVTVIGHNPAHEERLIRGLVDDYGWIEGHDGTLYPPHMEPDA